ncbi:peptidylprolyl isomerase [Tolypothrix sp. PCC 7910]|uniref:peptidylprolyl isomerase n=1 Tax=Tolypothrix sp. PCC 7910 TaxID=2099387 RepID=UPI0014278FB5|nr:peptidylprolyl isomerase [Tolypothrix sp. PCC 7910]QIR37001.1 peptidylprolyl isomerase [Tolypothrix sp. PCC 7910]
MSKILNISQKEIIEQVKISCQLPNLLEAIATHKIISNTAREAGIKVEVEELQQAADALRAANRLIKAEDTWNWLQKHYLSLEDFEQLAERNLISVKLAHHLFADKVEPYFYENQLNYLAAVTYEVVLDDEDLAWELFYAVSEGEITFQDITRQHIQNPELRRAGGYKGIKHRHEFKPDIASAVFIANPPELLKPIAIAQKVHLIWVEEIIQPKLDEQLCLKIMGDLFTDWLKKQIAQLEIIPHFESDTYSQPVQELLRIAS